MAGDHSVPRLRLQTAHCSPRRARPHGVPGVLGAAKEVREVRVRGVKVFSVLRTMRRAIQVRGKKAS
jgi:hypothetical protein